MIKDISTREMYRLINEAISKCYNHHDYPVNQAIKEFERQHWQAVKNHTQLGVFDEPIPNVKEVRQAVDFCDMLDDYRISIDVFNKDDVNLGQEFYRQLYEGINIYRPHISSENQSTYKILEKNIKRKLPEFKHEIILSEYNERALDIYKLRKEYDKNKQKNNIKFHERQAEQLFDDIFKKKELVDIPPSVDKLTTYSNLLKIVDCLPADKYKRSAKYNIKYSINSAIVKICQALGDNYSLAKINAEQNAIKYLKALRNAQSYAKSKNNFSSYRAQRQKDEYLYK